MVPEPVNAEKNTKIVCLGRGVFYMGNSNLNLGPTSWGLSIAKCLRRFHKYNGNIVIKII